MQLRSLLHSSPFANAFALSLGLVVGACAGGPGSGSDLFQGGSTNGTSGSSQNPTGSSGNTSGEGSSGTTTSGGTSGSSGGTSGSSGGTSGSSGGTSGSVKPPKLEVSAQILSATLADDCGSAEKPAAPIAPGDCAEPNGCNFCQQSNVQLSFKTGAGTPVKVKIVSVTVHEAATDKLLDALTARTPRKWTDNAYVPWDETLVPNAELRASYNLSAPAWAKMGTTSYSAKYQLVVTLEIDGNIITLESVDISRDPPVVT